MMSDKIINQLQNIKCHCQEMYESEIKNGDPSSSIWGKDVEALEMAIKALEQARWIPISEKLPKAFEFVNCTCHSLIDDRDDWVVESIYIPQPSDSPYSDWGNIPMLNSGDCEVVAWMHRDIPEPYKAESDKGSDDE